MYPHIGCASTSTAHRTSFFKYMMMVIMMMKMVMMCHTFFFTVLTLQLGSPGWLVVSTNRPIGWSDDRPTDGHLKMGSLVGSSADQPIGRLG